MTVRILSTVLPVCVTLFLGILLRKKAVIGREGIGALKKIAVDVTLPAVLFSSFASAEYTPRAMLLPLIMFILCVLALIAGFGLKKVFGLRNKLFAYLMSGFEAGMLGYGFLSLLDPGGDITGFALLDLGQVLFVFTVYKMMLSGKGNLGAVFGEAVRSPVLWSILAGLAYSASGLGRLLTPCGVTQILLDVAAYIAAPTGCLILLTIGYDLTLKGIPWKKVLVNCVLRFCVAAAFYGVLTAADRILLGGIIEAKALIIMLILPAPFVLPVFADVEEERAEIASTLTVMTLLCIALFILITVFRPAGA